MGSVNRAILVGNLGQDPEIRFTAGGQAVANFSVATSERFTDKAGERQERTEWHRIVAYGKLAELAKEYLAKGRQVYVEGRIQTRTWDNKDGAKRTTTEIVAGQIVFLTGGNGRQREVEQARGTEPAGDDAPGLTDDDIPF